MHVMRRPGGVPAGCAGPGGGVWGGKPSPGTGRRWLELYLFLKTPSILADAADLIASRIPPGRVIWQARSAGSRVGGAKTVILDVSGAAGGTGGGPKRGPGRVPAGPEGPWGLSGGRAVAPGLVSTSLAELFRLGIYVISGKRPALGSRKPY